MKLKYEKSPKSKCSYRIYQYGANNIAIMKPHVKRKWKHVKRATLRLMKKKGFPAAAFSQQVPNVNFRIHQSMELHNRCDGRCMKEKCQNVLRKSAPRVIAFWAPKGLGICVQERRAKGFHQQLWTLFCYPSDAQGTYTIDTLLPNMVPLEKSN